MRAARPCAAQRDAPELESAPMRRPATIAALALACCSRLAAGGPVPASLARVPDGYGAPYDARAVLTVQDRRLRLPSGRTCLPQEPACREPLAQLAGQALALELDGALRMADLRRRSRPWRRRSGTTATAAWRSPTAQAGAA